MSVYVLPALIALLAKMAILISAYRSIQNSRTFFNMVIVFGLHNLCEFLVFVQFGEANFGYVLTAYYVTSVWGLAFVLFYALEISQNKGRVLTQAIAGLAVVLSIVLLTSNMLVDGARSIGYVMTAVRGPFYWVFQLYSAAMFLLIVGFLVSGYRRAREHIVEIQCLSMLCALSPLVILGFLVMLLMNMGFNINAATILPIATTAFLVIALLSESKHGLTDIRRFLPWSPEKRTSNEIMDIFYARDEVDYRQAVSDIEKLLVVHKYQKNGENASATAELMGMPRSSLYSIFNRLKIESKGSK